MEANKRFSHGLQLLLSFTGGKLMDDNSRTVTFLDAAGTKQDYYNRNAEKSLSAQNVSKRPVISGNYVVPVGRLQKFLESPGQSHYTVGRLRRKRYSITLLRLAQIKITNTNNSSLAKPSAGKYSQGGRCTIT